MGYIQGEGRGQGSLFPVVLDDLVSVDHMCRVIDAFVARLALSELGISHQVAFHSQQKTSHSPPKSRSSLQIVGSSAPSLECWLWRRIQQ